MFTGIIEALGAVSEPFSEGKLWVSVPFAEESGPGHSVAVNGVCLTVVERRGKALLFELSEETVQRTALGALRQGSPVNLERPLRAGGELGGHFVQGHVDGVGTLSHVESLRDSWVFRFRLPAQLFDQLVPKGSIAIDGISLTVVELLPNQEFTVSIIPYTYHNTNLGTMPVGTPVNVETDILGKYVRKFMEQMFPGGGRSGLNV